MTKKLLLILIVFTSLNLFAQSIGLSNFRIINSEKNKVYFDSSEPITASTTNGFTINDKTISGITINTGSKAEHYFTVSSAFTFWDNSTIRYNGDSDISVEAFDLQYIDNKIVEPSASVERYASLAGSGSHDGTSEGNAWTLKEAAANATAGQKVWVKAGGDFKGVSFKNNGKVDKPIIVKGYVSTIGDIDGVSFHTYSIGDVVNNASAPTLKGGFGPTNDNGFTISGDYVIVENFQSHGWKRNFYSVKNTSAVIKNCLSHKTSVGRKPSPDGSGFYIRSDKTRIINSLSINSDMNGFFSMGKNNMIKDCSAYIDSNAPGGDYFYQIRGNNNILKGCLAKKTEKKANGQHGLSVKSAGIQTEYNLIEDCTTWSSSFPIEARHDEVKYNVFRNISINNDRLINNKGNGGAIVVMNGASYNIFDKITVTGGLAGIRFLSSPEKKDAPTAGHDNVFKNCIFRDNIYGITITEDTYRKNRETYNNYIQNCIFYKPTIMFNNKSNDVRDNHFINCIITEVSSKKSTTSNSIGWDYQNSNFHKNKKYANPTGNGNISVDPKFENPSTGNFRLKPDSPLIDKGKNIENVNFDFDGNSRPQGASTDIGAFEKKKDNPNLSANAGPDTTICSGSSTTLTASGGSDYVWSTGETTASITVSPTNTIIYTVTVSEGSDTDSDEVEVIVEISPLVNLGDNIIICSGESTTLTATGNGNFLWSTGETTATISVNPLITTTYSVMADACSTTVSDEIIVTVNPGITLDAGSDVLICNGESTTLTATTNGNVLWSTGETTSSITVTPSSTTTYAVTSSLGDCSKTNDIIVTVDETPTVDAGSDVSMCPGDSITLTATGEGNFLWSTGATTSSIDVSPSSTKIYTVTASNSCANDVIDEIIVTINPEVTLDTGSDVLICNGESTILTANTNGNILWSTGETTSSISVSPSETITYGITSTIGDCSITGEVVVTVNSLPSVSLGDDETICNGEELILTATGEGDFLWSTGETTKSIDVSPSSTTTYTVTASNSCTNDVTDEIIVTVNPGVTFDVGADVSICNGESTILTATTNGNILWNTGETTSSITVNPSSTATYSVTSSLGNCSKTDEVVVTVNNQPSVNLGDDETICNGEELILTATGEGDFLWSTGETTKSIDVSPSSTTTYTVTASNSCATVTDEVIITVNPEVTLDTGVGADVLICNGESTILTATTNGNILWSTGETTSSITVNPSSTTKYSVTSSLGNCSKTDDLEVKVSQLATVNAGSDVSMCPGDTITLTATGEGNFLWSTGETTSSINVRPSSTKIYTVFASNSCTNATDEIIITVNPEVTLDTTADVLICNGESTTLTATTNGSILWSTGETTSSITVNPSSTTAYSVISSLGNCSKTAQLEVIVKKLPTVNAGLDVSICSGDSITLTATGIGNFLWSTGETAASISVNPSDTTMYTVTTSTAGTCANSVTDNVTVNVSKAPVASANDDLVILAGSSIDLTVSGVGFFEWSTGEVGSRISVSPTVTTKYTVTATTGEGCSIDDEVVVTVVDEFVPTVITITVGQDVTICPGDTVIMEAPTGTRYLWSSGETASSIRISPSETTIYSVKVYNGDDSETSNSTITVRENCSEDISASTNNNNNLDQDQDMIVYPNPTTGLLNVKLKGYNNESRISVYNLNGTMLYTRAFDNKSRASVLREQLDLSKFGKGIYFIKFHNKDNIESKKVIVK